MYLSQQRWWYRISAANGSGVASISLRMRSLMSMSSSNTVCCLNTFQAFSWFRRYKVFNFRPGCFLSSGRMHQTHKFLSCRCPILERRRFGEGAGRGSAAADFGVSDADVDSLHTQEKNNKVLSSCVVVTTSKHKINWGNPNPIKQQGWSKRQMQTQQMKFNCQNFAPPIMHKNAQV